MVATLVFGTVELPAPVGHLSPWMDMVTRPISEVHGRLEAQTHRRFIKTHTPFDGLPWDERVTYIAVLRHPLDVALSMRDHMQTIDRERIRNLIRDVDPGIMATWEGEEVPDSDADYLRRWIEFDDDRWEEGSSGLGEFGRHALTYWERRNEPNVTLFHYDDMWADLPGEMARLASALGIDVDVAQLDEFVAAARFDSMRSRAALTVPDSDISAWKDPKTFFSQGGRRAWVDLLSAEDLARFHHRLTEVVGEELASWLARQP